MKGAQAGGRWALGEGRAGGHKRATLGRTGRWGAQAGGSAGASSRRTGAWQGLAAGRAAGPAGYALGALSLFLARFDSVFFRSHIFGHCL